MQFQVHHRIWWTLVWTALIQIGPTLNQETDKSNNLTELLKLSNNKIIDPHEMNSLAFQNLTVQPLPNLTGSLNVNPNMMFGQMPIPDKTNAVNTTEQLTNALNKTSGQQTSPRNSNTTQQLHDKQGRQGLRTRQIVKRKYVDMKSGQYSSIVLQLCAMEYEKMANDHQAVWKRYPISTRQNGANQLDKPKGKGLSTGNNQAGKLGNTHNPYYPLGGEYPKQLPNGTKIAPKRVIQNMGLNKGTKQSLTDVAEPRGGVLGVKLNGTIPDNPILGSNQVWNTGLHMGTDTNGIPFMKMEHEVKKQGPDEKTNAAMPDSPNTRDPKATYNLNSGVTGFPETPNSNNNQPLRANDQKVDKVNVEPNKGNGNRDIINMSPSDKSSQESGKPVMVDNKNSTIPIGSVQYNSTDVNNTNVKSATGGIKTNDMSGNDINNGEKRPNTTQNKDFPQIQNQDSPMSSQYVLTTSSALDSSNSLNPIGNDQEDPKLNPKQTMNDQNQPTPGDHKAVGPQLTTMMTPTLGYLDKALMVFEITEPTVEANVSGETNETTTDSNVVDTKQDSPNSEDNGQPTTNPEENGQSASNTEDNGQPTSNPEDGETYTSFQPDASESVPNDSADKEANPELPPANSETQSSEPSAAEEKPGNRETTNEGNQVDSPTTEETQNQADNQEQTGAENNNGDITPTESGVSEQPSDATNGEQSETPANEENAGSEQTTGISPSEDSTTQATENNDPTAETPGNDQDNAPTVETQGNGEGNTPEAEPTSNNQEVPIPEDTQTTPGVGDNNESEQNGDTKANPNETNNSAETEATVDISKPEGENNEQNGEQTSPMNQDETTLAPGEGAEGNPEGTTDTPQEQDATQAINTDQSQTQDNLEGGQSSDAPAANDAEAPTVATDVSVGDGENTEPTVQPENEGQTQQSTVKQGDVQSADNAPSKTETIDKTISNLNTAQEDVRKPADVEDKNFTTPRTREIIKLGEDKATTPLMESDHEHLNKTDTKDKHIDDTEIQPNNPSEPNATKEKILPIDTTKVENTKPDVKLKDADNMEHSTNNDSEDVHKTESGNEMKTEELSKKKDSSTLSISKVSAQGDEHELSKQPIVKTNDVTKQVNKTERKEPIDYGMKPDHEVGNSEQALADSNQKIEEVPKSPKEEVPKSPVGDAVPVETPKKIEDPKLIDKENIDEAKNPPVPRIEKLDNGNGTPNEPIKVKNVPVEIPKEKSKEVEPEPEPIGDKENEGEAKNPLKFKVKKVPTSQSQETESKNHPLDKNDKSQPLGNNGETDQSLPVPQNGMRNGVGNMPLNPNYGVGNMPLNPNYGGGNMPLTPNNGGGNMPPNPHNGPGGSYNGGAGWGLGGWGYKGLRYPSVGVGTGQNNSGVYFNLIVDTTSTQKPTTTKTTTTTTTTRAPPPPPPPVIPSKGKKDWGWGW
uniref:Uncharacterized protein n=1 Tax=Cacopsylla melanoneura TaxID=428564 RepID=A0A8D8V4M2_9HEMI